MARPKGSKNKPKPVLPDVARLKTEARIKFLASIVVDRMQYEHKLPVNSESGSYASQ